ncbi:GNAT family N-acetyltransferase [Gammaproteobacteria bacterium 42_54_T18]|nr:GNAT family N-acetyltransferase [Gammaproteobacteria bacterium 42_54_T18]
MNIRPFEQTDYPLVLDIYSKSKLDELIYESQEFKFLPLDQDAKRLAELQESDIYVFDNNGVIGYGAVFGEEIRALFIHPSGRGKGFGQTLLEYLLTKISGAASLYVAKTNAPAKALYEKFGFIVVDEFEASYNGVPVCANKMMRAASNG